MSYRTLRHPRAARAACFSFKGGEELEPSRSPRDGDVFIPCLWLSITVGVFQDGRRMPTPPPQPTRGNKVPTLFLRSLSEYNVFPTSGSGWEIVVATVIRRSWRHSALLWIDPEGWDT